MKEFFHFADIHLIATFIHHIAHLLILVLNSILKPLSIFMCTTCTSTLKFLSRFFNIFHLMNYEQLLQYINVMIKVFACSFASGKMENFLEKSKNDKCAATWYGDAERMSLDSTAARKFLQCFR